MGFEEEFVETPDIKIGQGYREFARKGARTRYKPNEKENRQAFAAKKRTAPPIAARGGGLQTVAKEVEKSSKKASVGTPKVEEVRDWINSSQRDRMEEGITPSLQIPPIVSTSRPRGRPTSGASVPAHAPPVGGKQKNSSRVLAEMLEELYAQELAVASKPLEKVAIPGKTGSRFVGIPKSIWMTAIGIATAQQLWAANEYVRSRRGINKASEVQRRIERRITPVGSDPTKYGRGRRGKSGGRRGATRPGYQGGAKGWEATRGGGGFFFNWSERVKSLVGNEPRRRRDGSGAPWTGYTQPITR